jgi:hypothetical protein
MIGRNADIAVTSVLQTTAGKMIFGRLWDEAHENGGSIHTTDTRGINTGARRPYRDSRPPAPAPQAAPPPSPQPQPAAPVATTTTPVAARGTVNPEDPAAR